MNTGRRGLPARVGLVALNVLSPGLGLLRVADWRRALPWLVAPLALIAVIGLVCAVAPRASFLGFAIVMAVSITAYLGVVAVSAAMTWRGSAQRVEHQPWWSRWYSLLLIFIGVSLVASFAVDVVHGYYKPFYAPSGSMAPTIQTQDKFLVDMRGGRSPARGEIVLLRTNGERRIARVVGLPGDRVAMRQGVPVVNGRAVPQRPAGTVTVETADGMAAVRRLYEILPGETGGHFVLDQGPTFIDSMDEVEVSPGHYFVLGDNRDDSADSRLPQEAGGIGLVPVSALEGRALFIHWSPADWSRTGTSLTRAK